MKKSHLFIAAGAAVLMCGCGPKSITGPKPVIPAPLDDPAAVSAPAMTADPGKAAWETPENKKNASATETVPQFEPLTNVYSSGGIESTGKAGKKSAAISAKGGVYVVKSGDTPDRIARKHGVRLSALMAANNLDQQSARRLRVGQKLTIPGKNAKFAAPKKSKKTASAPADNATATATVDAEGKYTVKSGDTPERIARKNRVRLSELLKANNLDQQSARRLQIGQKLIIPGKAAASEAAPAVPPAIPAVENNAPAADAAPAVTADQPVTTDVVAPAADTASENVAPAVTTEGDANSDIEVTEITEDITAAALAAKYNVPESVISEKNSGKTEFKKGDVIFVPTKK